MLTFFSFLVTASMGLLAPVADASFSNLHLRETSSGVVLVGTIALPRGLTPTVAMHIDVVGTDGSVVTSRPLPSAHPRTARYRLRRFAVELPAGFVPAQLALHHGVHP